MKQEAHWLKTMGSSQLRSNIDNILSKNWKIKIKYFD